MIEHPEYATPPESRSWLALELAAWLRQADPETGQTTGIAELRETCGAWLRRAVREGRMTP